VEPLPVVHVEDGQPELAPGGGAHSPAWQGEGGR
jgi:hypothetical protein